MKKGIRTILGCLLSATMVVSLFFSIGSVEVQAKGTSYYVDSVGGKDSNSGTSTNSAWKTLKNVNAKQFSPGDKIYFKAGCQWDGMLHPLGSGDSTGVITIDKYGTGSKPRINGKGAEAGVMLDGQEYWTISNLDVTNEASSRAIRQGIYVYGKNSGITHNITITDCEVHDVTGENRRALDTYKSMYWNSGIYVSMPGRSNSGKHYDNVIIKNNYVHDVLTSGIRINQREDFIVDPYHTNVLIENNTIARTGSDGMIVANCVSPLIQYNLVYDSGAMGNSNDTKIIAGMWSCGTSDATFQYNEVARTVLFESDGTAFDTDWGTGGITTFQYNYTHGNQGGFWLDCAGINKDPSHEKTVLRYNVSADDLNYIIRAGDMPTEVYNNTFYKSSGKLNACFGNSGTKHYFWNNIFNFPETPDWAGSKYENNLYYPCAAPSSDDMAICADPKLVNPTKPQDGFAFASNYKINNNSPAVGKGMYIEDNGGKDLWGNTINAGTVDIGAHQTSATASNNSFNMARDFSHSQGNKGWFYYTVKNGNYIPMKWDSSQGKWQGENTYNLVWAPGKVHPEADDTAIGWKADSAGTINIKGTVKKIDTGNDGIKVKILKNGTQIWPSSGWQSIGGNDTSGASHDFAAEVNAGDMIYFVVNKNQTTYNDGSYWNPTITYGDFKNIESYSFKDDFSDVQGQNNWKYLENNGDSYSEMRWDSSVSRWRGSNTYSLIWKPAQLHPDGTDTVVAWTAPHSGNVCLTGQPKKVNSGYDGVRVKIVKNSEKIWPSSDWMNIAGNDTTGVGYEFTTYVNSGDTLYFVVNQNGNNYGDEIYWNPVVSFED